MSKFDRRYIENLQRFSDALEGLVDFLKAEYEKGGESGTSDVINKMAGHMENEKISQIVEDLNEVKDRTKTIEDNTQKILQEVKDAREAKESGMFGKIRSTENRGKIVQGIEVVTLIAGAVLAMGAAFKLVGDVDFMTVIGLSTAIFLLSKTFSDIIKMDNLSWDKVGMASLLIVAMSGSLLAASLLLSEVKPLSLMQMFTIGAIGISLGIASLGLMKGLQGFKKENQWMIAVIPALLPAMAAGILASAEILSNVPTLSPMQLLSIIGLGIALIPISFAFSLIVKGLKKTNLKSIIFAGTAIPVISAGLVASSFILQEVQRLNNIDDIILTSIGVGLSTIALIPAFLLISKAKLSMSQIMQGGIAIIAIAGVIMVSSHILSLGNYEKFPPIEWAAGVGLSLLSFVPSVVALGILAISGIGMVAIGLGLLAVMSVAGTIVAVSHILGAGDYSSFPSAEWAAGVGLSMVLFTLPIITLGSFIMGTLGIGGLVLIAGAGAILSIATMMVHISEVFSGTDFENYPSIDWVKGVGSALELFSSHIKNMDVGLVDTIKLTLIANAIIKMAEKFNDNADLFSQPNAEWLANFKNIISLFESLPDRSKANGVNAIIDSLNRLSVMGITNITPIILLSKAIDHLSGSLDDLNEKSVDKLLNLSKGVMVMSVIDNESLSQVLDTLEDKNRQLSVVFDEKSSPLVDSLMKMKSPNEGGVNEKDAGNIIKPKDKEEEKESVKVLREISEKMDGIMDRLEKVEQASNIEQDLF